MTLCRNLADNDDYGGPIIGFVCDQEYVTYFKGTVHK